MPLSRERFKNLAKKLVSVTAGDIKGPAVFKLRSSFDYKTQESVPEELYVDDAVLIGIESSEFSINGIGKTKVEKYDARLVVPYDYVDKTIRLSTEVDFNGYKYSIESIKVDAAEAAYMIMLKR